VRRVHRPRPEGRQPQRLPQGLPGPVMYMHSASAMGQADAMELS
jgi:hypothetical protein